MQIGWFHTIALRHGDASIEVQQARAFIEEQGQLYFGFTDEIKKAITPPATEDSAARRSITKRLVDSAKRHGSTVTITGLGKSVKIDKDGVHTEPTEAQLDEATKMAYRDGHLTRSALQRTMRVHYNHACAIVDRLVAAKILGAENGVGRFETVAVAAQPAA